MKIRKEELILGSEFEVIVHHGGRSYNDRDLRPLVMLYPQSEIREQ